MTDARAHLHNVLCKTHTPAQADELIDAIADFVGSVSGRYRSQPETGEALEADPPEEVVDALAEDDDQPEEAGAADEPADEPAEEPAESHDDTPDISRKKSRHKKR